MPSYHDARQGIGLGAGTRALTLFGALSWSACVVKYGQEPETAAKAPTVIQTADLGPAKVTIGRMIESTEEVDQQDRLTLALELANTVQAHPETSPAAVAHYLDSLLKVEARGRPVSIQAPELAATIPDFGSGKVVEQEIDEATAPPPATPEPTTQLFDPEAAPQTAPAGPDVASLLTAARRHHTLKEYDAAMKALEPCRDQPCWKEVDADWVKARDARVFELKEKAAMRFLSLRGEADANTQREGLLEISTELSAVRAKYPGSAYDTDLVKHIERVQRELEALPEP